MKKQNPECVVFGNDRVQSWHSIVESLQSAANLWFALEPNAMVKPMDVLWLNSAFAVFNFSAGRRGRENTGVPVVSIWYFME